MNELTSRGHQIIARDGIPLFVVVPYDEYVEMAGQDDGVSNEEVTIPLEVSKISNLEDKTLIRAWREHLGLTQEEVATRMGVTRAAFAQMESPEANPRRTTLERIAQALGVTWEQLRA